MATHLKYCMRSAYDEGIGSLPQQDMIDLGISYQCATPQSIADQWWFWNCENIPDPLPERLAVLDIEDPHKFIGYGLAQSEADKIKSYKSIIKGEKMPDQKCMNCKGQDIFEGECLSCGHEVESAVRFVTKNFPDVDGIAVGDITNVSIPAGFYPKPNIRPITKEVLNDTGAEIKEYELVHLAADGKAPTVNSNRLLRGFPVLSNILPVLDAESDQTPRRIRGSFKGVPFVMESIKRDSRLVEVPPRLVTGLGVEPQPKGDKPSLCAHKAEFKCTASMDNPMDKCRFFAPDGHLYWLCISRAESTYECLNPTAKAEALSKQVAIVEELSARIAELEVKWAGANLEAHGILKLIHGLMSNWGGSKCEHDRMEQLIVKAAEKFGWDK